MKGLTDIPGIRVGHATDLEGVTGCTAMLFENGAMAGYDIRGGATGTEELDILNPLHVTGGIIHGLVFSGGSAFGLEACSGVRRYLEKQGAGFETSVARVPLVSGAILFDLAIGSAKARPTREMGEAAAAAATAAAVPEGSVGAGTGATVGKLRGMKSAMKGGIGSATVPIRGALVSALAAVNAHGDVRDPSTGRILAGARTAPGSQEFVDTAKAYKEGARGGFRPQNTTLVAVATNARLNKAQVTKLAQFAQHGLVRALSPAHTMSDGDIAFALSIGEETADINALGIAAGEAVALAIVRAVQKAKGIAGVPGLAD